MNHVVQDNRKVCPYVGLEEDPETFMAFPSAWNCCYRSRRRQPIRLEYQGEVCLSPLYAECEIFRREQGAPLPSMFRAWNLQSRRGKFRRRILVLLAGILLLWIYTGWQMTVRDFFPILSGSIDPRPLESAPSSIPTSREITPHPIINPSPIPLLIVSPSPLPTASVVNTTQPAPVGHDLEVPFGTDYQLVIHRVRGGENLNSYADQYHTTVEAILDVNYNLRLPLWANQLVVIPLNISDASALPAFEVYQVNEEGLTAAQLASNLSVDLVALLYFNDLEETAVLPVGAWLILPRPRSAP